MFGGRSSLFVSYSANDLEERNLGEHTSTKLPRKRYGALLAQAPDGHLLTDEQQLIDPKRGRAQRVLPGERTGGRRPVPGRVVPTVPYRDTCRHRAEVP